MVFSDKCAFSVYDKHRRAGSHLLQFSKIPVSKKNQYELAIDFISDGDTVLDVGAYDKSFGKLLKKKRKNCIYKSLDSDKTIKHDYYDIKNVKKKFDIVVLFGTIPFLSPEELFDMIKNTSRISNKCVLTIINPYFPLGHFYNDINHKRPYTPQTLFGLTKMHGFKELEFYRLSSSKFNWFRQLLIRFTNQDFAPGLFLFASK